MKFLDEVEDGFNRRLNKRLKSFEDLRKKVDGTLESPNSLKFGAYILSEKVINDSRMEIAWSKWIRDLYDKNEDMNIFKENFCDSFISS
jgi:hypothetical protein